ncbi:MAG TPA: hypothetical protein VIH42_00625 [Thermoguttaceae bacterium]
MIEKGNTTMLEKLIGIFVALIFLCIFVPQYLPMKTADTDRSLWNSSQQATAGEELTRLDETYNAVVLLQNRNPVKNPTDAAKAYDDLMRVAHNIVEKSPEWKTVSQRVANGDFSYSATSAMYNAIAEAKLCRDQLNEHQKILEMIVKEPQKWAQRKEQDRLRKEAEEKKRQSGEGLGVTMAGYRFLKDGMSRWDVDLVLDCFGVEQSRSGDLAVYVWKKGSAHIVVTFDEDKLVAKSHFGL